MICFSDVTIILLSLVSQRFITVSSLLLWASERFIAFLTTPCKNWHHVLWPGQKAEVMRKPLLNLFVKYKYKNTILWNIITILNNCFLCEYIIKCNLFLWSKLYFQHHYSSLQCHMIFRNHYHMLIGCSTCPVLHLYLFLKQSHFSRQNSKKHVLAI